LLRKLEPQALMKRTPLLVFRIAWIIASLAVLVVTLAKYDGAPNSDVADFEGGTMIFLSFPAGWIVVALFVGVSAVMTDYEPI
jgi:hypothetical protein